MKNPQKSPRVKQHKKVKKPDPTETESDCDSGLELVYHHSEKLKNKTSGHANRNGVLKQARRKSKEGMEMTEYENKLLENERKREKKKNSKTKETLNKLKQTSENFKEKEDKLKKEN